VEALLPPRPPRLIPRQPRILQQAPLIPPEEQPPRDPAVRQPHDREEPPLPQAAAQPRRQPLVVPRLEEPLQVVPLLVELPPAVPQPGVLLLVQVELPVQEPKLEQRPGRHLPEPRPLAPRTAVKSEPAPTDRAPMFTTASAAWTSITG
jgi:hypothetical protein